MEVSRTSLLIRRAGAYFVDFGAIILISLWLDSQENLPFGGGELVFVYLFLYPLCEWLFNGRTPGKYVFGIIVINGAGDPPTLVQTLIRGITRMIEAPLGIITIFIFAQSERCQRVGDMLARTYVIAAKDLAQLRAQMSFSATSHS
ncbi:RDD family protein [Pseudomonas fluorescens]|uniref:RDD domain-containing protein n=1 Tax=Pseudomonas fluorescens TaxID=294 RepID=A0A5E7FHU7_PSEFL|nr:RDD family protein [Pseudomonas fluorescens]VVO37727.1 hypothetical protein PS691_05456 [Pseudomonas fluorescens]